MTKLRRIVIAAVVLVLFEARGASAGTKIPKWCAAGDVEAFKQGSSLKKALGTTQPAPRFRDQLYALVATTCAPDDEAAAHQSQLADERQKWSARLELTEDDWVDFAAWASLDPSTRGAFELQIPSEIQMKLTWLSSDAIDQWEWITRGGGHDDRTYIVDALGPKLTELGRLGYVSVCIDAKDNVAWATCQADIDRLDFKKMAAEIRANTKYAPAERARLRFHIAINIKRLLAEHMDKIQKLIASDPGYARLFELAAAIPKDQRYRADAALLGLVLEMDEARLNSSTPSRDKNARSAFAGCEDKTWAAWKTAVAAIPAKTYEGLYESNSGLARSFGEFGTRQIITVPDGYLASVALVTCMTAGQDKDAKPDALIWSLGKYTSEYPGFRGPRTTIQSALLISGIPKLDFPRVQRSFFKDTVLPSAVRGVIAKLTPTGKTVTVEFVKKMITEVQCDDFKATNRILQFRADGSPVYDVICTRNKTVTFNSADPPQVVDVKYVSSVKPGMFVAVQGSVVLGVWAKPTATVPILVYGVPVK